MEQLALEPASIWDTGTIDTGLRCYTTEPTPQERDFQHQSQDTKLKGGKTRTHKQSCTICLQALHYLLYQAYYHWEFLVVSNQGWGPAKTGIPIWRWKLYTIDRVLQEEDDVYFFQVPHTLGPDSSSHSSCGTCQQLAGGGCFNDSKRFLPGSAGKHHGILLQRLCLFLVPLHPSEILNLTFTFIAVSFYLHVLWTRFLLNSYLSCEWKAIQYRG